jgi:uncharacterized OB-fold protein
VLFTEAGTLLGGACADCGAVRFPTAARCPRCASNAMETVELPRRGTLWSFTVQGFRPKSPPYAGPADFVPYGVGYVDLGPVIVEGRLTENDPERLRIGMELEVVLEPFGDGTTYAFAPVPAG